MTSNRSIDPLRLAMQSAFPPYDAEVAGFYEMQEYHLGWRDEDLAHHETGSGKMLRPKFCLLACQVVGGAEDQALPLAAAIQLLHDFTLIHDDIEDNSPTRRGRRTLWNRWGIAQGINAGDGMFVLAQLELLRLAEVGVPGDVVLEIARSFNQTILRICEGQFLDIGFEERLDISETDYLAMISRKTAALIAAALGLGAILGQGTAAQTKALYDYGEALGLAFQIEDDILGIWGEQALTGKPDAHDIWGRKKSLPIVHALVSADSEDAALLRNIYLQPELTAAQVATVLAILERTGARGYTAGVARFYHDEATNALGRIHDAQPTALAELYGLTKQLLGRVK